MSYDLFIFYMARWRWFVNKIFVYIYCLIFYNSYFGHIIWDSVKLNIDKEFKMIPISAIK